MQSNVGYSIMNDEVDRSREGRDSDRARKQAEDILGKSFDMPPGILPRVP